MLTAYSSTGSLEEKDVERNADNGALFMKIQKETISHDFRQGLSV